MRRSFLVLAVLAVPFSLTACGGDSGLADALVDAAPAELNIESADCPDVSTDDVGKTFDCTATTSDGNELTVPGEVTADSEATFDFNGLGGASGATGESGSQ